MLQGEQRFYPYTKLLHQPFAIVTHLWHAFGGRQPLPYLSPPFSISANNTALHDRRRTNQSNRPLHTHANTQIRRILRIHLPLSGCLIANRPSRRRHLILSPHLHLHLHGRGCGRGGRRRLRHCLPCCCCSSAPPRSCRPHRTPWQSAPLRPSAPGSSPPPAPQQRCNSGATAVTVTAKEGAGGGLRSNV